MLSTRVRPVCSIRPASSAPNLARKFHSQPEDKHTQALRHTIEDEIREINASPELSEEFKYRNSMRLFARVEEMKLFWELNAFADKWEAAVQRIVRTQRRKGVDERTA